MSEVKTPWKDYMGDVPMHLDYFQGSMFEAVERMAELYPNNIAFDFMGKSTTYKKMVQEIEKCAKSLKTLGVRPGDKVTIAMPNCPQAIYMFYAVNLVGGIANMIHPLSAEKEIEFYLNASESTTAITLDQFYDKFEHIRQNTGIINIIIASVKDALSRTIRAGYMLTEGRKIQKIPDDAPVIRWKEFMDMSRYCFYKNYRVERGYNDPAVILYSGGTTGTTKGIVLTNGNFNALGQQIIATNPMFRPGDRMLAAMPLFHGFGLGVCVHSMLSQGGRCILIPRFTAKSYAKQIVKYKCNFIAGVPTLYEALLRLPSMDGADLSSLKGVFSGGDSLSIELKKKFDKFLYDHHAVIQVREGYGTTETVTACCLTPTNIYKEGSIGLPFPDTYIKIVEPDTDKEVPYGTEGEILLAGPTVMKEYMNNPEETARTLRKHADGLTWVYTGDLGTMDDQGFIYFKGRAKRMIISSGYNVYPGQLENILDAHEKVQMSCIIGVPDAYKMQKVKAFVMLKPGVPADDATKQELLAYCRKHIAKYAMPYDIEFREELPKTLVGKVAYRVLEDEEKAKLAARQPEEAEYNKQRRLTPMDKELKRHYTLLVDFLGHVMGPDYEIALHELKDDSNEIIAIANGELTGRHLGSPLSNKMLEYLAGNLSETQNYVLDFETVSATGKTMCSSSMLIRGRSGELTGFLCINFDASRYEELARKVMELCGGGLKRGVPSGTRLIADSNDPVEMPVRSGYPTSIAGATASIVSQVVAD